MINNTYEILKSVLSGDTLTVETADNTYEVLKMVYDTDNEALRVNVTNLPGGITSSFQVGFSEFIIENGLITQENYIWMYEGVLTVEIDTQLGVNKYRYGYAFKTLGSIDPPNFNYILWTEEQKMLSISSVETIGKVMIDEGKASELILEASDFTISNKIAKSGVIPNPFPVEGGTHTIKIQYT